MSDSPELQIICLLVTHTCEPVGNIFVVRIPRDDIVASLMDEVKKKCGYLVANVPVLDLITWIPHLFFPSLSSGLSDHVKNLHLNSEDKRCTATRLDLGALLQKCFPEPLSNRHVHVVIQLPPSRGVVGLSRPQKEEADQVPPFMKYVQDSSYVRRAPSDVAIASEFRRLQNNEGRILNDRPHKDVQITPIALLYPPFGEFLDHIRNPPMDSDDLDLAELEAAVNEFSSLMCQHHDKEDERRDEVLKALNVIFECYLPSLLTRMAPSPVSGDRCSDGHANGPADVLETIIGFENELGSGNTDPEVQITAYYAQSVAKGSSGPHNVLCNRFLFPALGISLIGSYIGLSALVFLDKPRFVGLTPLLSACSPSGDDSAAPMLFHAFWAACMLRARICRDTQQAMDYPPVPLKHRNLPYVHQIPAWSSNADVEEQHLEFTIKSVVVQGKPWNDKRFLYLAKMQNEYVIVKFTRRYCTELHQFCAERGHAPKLLGYGTVPGGWHVVVMELVIQDIGKTLAQYARTHLERWEKDLTHLMEEFHGEGLVHGDLRDVNLILRTGKPETIMLVDYDWGGKHGDVSFPTRLLHEDLTGGEEVKSREITKEHDIRVLRTTFQNLRLSSFKLLLQ